jgi:hypothetical protein
MSGPSAPSKRAAASFNILGSWTPVAPRRPGSARRTPIARRASCWKRHLRNPGATPSISRMALPFPAR